MSNETANAQLTVEKITKDAEDLNSQRSELSLLEFMLHGHISFLLAKLATIERDTAEKCAEIIGHVADGASAMDKFCQIEDLQESIRHHFNLGETP